MIFNICIFICVLFVVKEINEQSNSIFTWNKSQMSKVYMREKKANNRKHYDCVPFFHCNFSFKRIVSESFQCKSFHTPVKIKASEKFVEITFLD